MVGRWGGKGRKGEERGEKGHLYFTYRLSQEQSEHETGYKQIECKIVIIIPKKERLEIKLYKNRKKEKKRPKGNVA